MIRKMIIILTVALVWACFSGCGGSKDDKMMNALDEAVTGVSPSDNSKSGDDTLIEIKHWKYSNNDLSPSNPGSAESSTASAQGSDEVQAAIPQEGVASPAYASNNSDAVVTIQLITQEEMEQIMCNLIDLGFMGKYATSQDEFQKAISLFQKDNGLPVTGTLDSATLQILKK